MVILQDMLDVPTISKACFCCIAVKKMVEMVNLLSSYIHK